MALTGLHIWMIVDRCSTRIGFCEGRSLKCDCYVKVKDDNTIQGSPIGGKASLIWKVLRTWGILLYNFYEGCWRSQYSRWWCNLFSNLLKNLLQMSEGSYILWLLLQRRFSKVQWKGAVGRMCKSPPSSQPLILVTEKEALRIKYLHGGRTEYHYQLLKMKNPHQKGQI